jgi:hypothetical protein
VGIWQNLLDRGDIGAIIDSLTALSNAIGAVTKYLGGLGTVTIFGSGFLSAFKDIGRAKMLALVNNKYADSNMCPLGY